MDAKKIDTIEMTRKIRDEHAKRLAGKSHAERMAFYRECAKKMERKIPVLLSELAIADGGRGDYSKDRHASLDDQDLDTIVKRIQERREASKKSK